MNDETLQSALVRRNPGMTPEKLNIVLEFLEQDESVCSVADLHVLPDGEIVRRDWTMPMSFGFTCFGIAVTANVAPRGTGLAMALKAVLGNVPFTAEAATARRSLIAQIENRNGLVKTDGREVRAEDTVLLPGAVKPTALVGIATEFMLRLEPEIDALAGTIMQRAAAA